jgi:hypothetical protein
MQGKTPNPLLFVNSLPCVFPFPSLEGIHALDAMNAPLSHRFAASNMGAAKLTSWLEKHLDT